MWTGKFFNPERKSCGLKISGAPIRLGLLKTTNQIAACKGEYVSEDFIPILERPSLFFYKQKQVFLYWPYFDIADAAFTMVKPNTLGMGFKRVQNSINQPKIKVFGTH